MSTLKINTIIFKVIHRIKKCTGSFEDFKNRKLIKSYANFQTQFYISFWANAAKSIGAQLIDVGYGFSKIELNGKKTYVSNGNVMLDDHVTLKIAANKPLILKILNENGIRTAQFIEYKNNTIHKAINFLNSSNADNAVVKPANGTSSGKGVTTNINNTAKLKKATALASSFNENILIEEQIEGDSYRLLYLNGKFIDAIRRDPPSVIGDDKNNIKQLIQLENKKRMDAKGRLTFHPLIIDMECKLKLKEQGLNIKYVPKKNKKIILKKVVNQNNRFDNHIVRDKVHPDTILIGEKIVHDLGVTLAGVDIITRNIEKTLNESNGIINEINTTPGLHLHILVAEEDKINPIGEMILKQLLKN